MIPMSEHGGGLSYGLRCKIYWFSVLEYKVLRCFEV